jgi:hypothetical protein
MDYIAQIKKSQLATKVKLADLDSHLQSRNNIPDSLVKRYERAKALLVK